MKHLLATSLLMIVCQTASAQSWWDKGKELLGGLGGNDESTTEAVGELTVGDLSAGLKDALKVGTGNVVSQLGQEGGFGLDEAIRIALPDELQTAKEWLEKVGMADSLVDLENRMNRAAEVATPKAKELFWNAIQDMSIDDAKQIYNGPNDAATQYFRSKMGGPLGDLMRPEIQTGLQEAGAVKTFDNIMNKYEDIPFVPDIKADLTEHTVNKGLDGIFYYLAKEEAAIRENPAKRTTDLLKKVFSK